MEDAIFTRSTSLHTGRVELLGEYQEWRRGHRLVFEIYGPVPEGRREEALHVRMTREQTKVDVVRKDVEWVQLNRCTA